MVVAFAALRPPAAAACAADHAAPCAAPINDSGAPASRANPTPLPLFVQVVLNGQDRGDMLVLRAGDRFYAAPEELLRTGLVLPDDAAGARHDGAPLVDLAALPGLQLAFDESALRLRLTADTARLPRTVLGAPAPAPAERLAADGAYLNWSFDADARMRRPALAFEAGAHWHGWLYTHEAYLPDGSPRWVRMRSSAQRDWPEQQQRLVLGDVQTRSWEFGTTLRMAGATFGRSFELDPWQLRHPTSTVRGQAATSADVEVLVDGRRVRTERVPAGAFEIRDLDLQPGARDVQVVLRDAYGRTQRLDQPVYATRQLLRAGLHDGQVAFGVLRRAQDTGSSTYGGAAASAVHRWGWSNGLTLGWAAQAAPGALVAGAQAAGTVSSLGLWSATLATARGSGPVDSGRRLADRRWGAAVALSHSFESARDVAGVSLRRQRAWPHLAGLGDTGAGDRTEWLAWAGHTWPALGTLAFSHAVTRWSASAPAAADLGTPELESTLHSTGLLAVPTAGLRRSSQVGWSGALPGSIGGSRARWRVGIARLHDAAGASTQLQLTLTVPLEGGALAAVGAGRSDGSRARAPASTQSVQLAQLPPSGSGWGYDAEATRFGPVDANTDSATRRLLASAQWNSAIAIWRATASRTTPVRGTVDDAAHLSAAGGIVWLGGRAWPSRPLSGSWLLAQLSPLAGVPVEVNGVVAGSTDATGRVLLTGLPAHTGFDVGIEPARLPIEWRVDTPKRRVLLGERSGAVVPFDVAPLRAWTARLVDADGRAMAMVAVQIEAAGTRIDGRTGLEGVLYLDQPPAPLLRGTAVDGTRRCTFELRAAAASATSAASAGLHDLGEVACRAVETQKRSEGPR